MNSYLRALASAEQAKAATQAAASRWWDNAGYWADCGPCRSSTEWAAINAVLNTCAKVPVLQLAVVTPQPQLVALPKTALAGFAGRALHYEPMRFDKDIGDWVFDIDAIVADINAAIRAWFGDHKDSDDPYILAMQAKRARRSAAQRAQHPKKLLQFPAAS